MLRLAAVCIWVVLALANVQPVVETNAPDLRVDPSAAFSVDFHSRTTDSRFLDKGSLLVDGIIVPLPGQTSLDFGQHTLDGLSIPCLDTGGDHYLFDHWESSGSVSIENGGSQSTQFSVSGSASITMAEAKFDFALDVAPTSQSVVAGGTASYSVTVDAYQDFTTNNGYSTTLDTSLVGMPPGATFSLGLLYVSQSAPSTTKPLFIVTDSATPPGSYSLTLTETVTSSGNGGCNWISHQRTMSLSVLSEQVAKPDMVPTSLIPTQGIVEGSLVSFSYSVRNQGTADAVGGFRNTLWIDGVVLANDDWTDSLLTGQTKSGAFTPDWKAQAGEHLLELAVDSRDSIVESDESNNTMSDAIQVASVPHVSVQLSSRSATGDNLGSIVWEYVPRSLPTSLSLALGVYHVSPGVPDSLSFGYWDVGGGVSVSNPQGRTVDVTVTGAGTLVAVFFDPLGYKTDVRLSRVDVSSPFSIAGYRFEAGLSFIYPPSGRDTTDYTDALYDDFSIDVAGGATKFAVSTVILLEYQNPADVLYAIQTLYSVFFPNNALLHFVGTYCPDNVCRVAMLVQFAELTLSDLATFVTWLVHLAKLFWKEGDLSSVITDGLEYIRSALNIQAFFLANAYSNFNAIEFFSLGYVLDYVLTVLNLYGTLGDVVFIVAKLAILATLLADPPALAIEIAKASVSIAVKAADLLISYFWSDAPFLPALHWLSAIVDPPGLTVETSVYDADTGVLVLGHDKVTGSFVTNSSAGFTYGDAETTYLILDANESFKVELSGVGTNGTIPYSVVLYSALSGNGSSAGGWLSAGQNVSATVNGTGLLIAGEDRLVVASSLSSHALVAGDPVEVFVTVTTQAGALEANATVIVSTGGWNLTAVHTVGGSYEVSVPTGNLSGHIFLDIYASKEGVLGGYDQLFIDVNTRPIAVLSVSPSSGNVTTTFAVDASASSDREDSDPALQVRWDWQDDGSWDTSWSSTKTAQHQYVTPGAYTIRLGVQDTGGLTSNVTKQVVVIAPPVPDTTRPSVMVASPASGETVTSASVTVFGTASDNVAVQKVELSTDGTTWILASGTTSWSGVVTLAEGQNTIFVRATDTSGNTATATISVTVQTPATGPAPQGLDLTTVGLVSMAVASIAAVGVAMVLFQRRRRP